MIDQIVKADSHIHTHSDGAASVPERQQTAGPRRLVGATPDGE
jgi:hypothetical protein